MTTQPRTQTRTQTKVLVCGLLSADLAFDVSAIPTDAIKYRSDSVSIGCGGGGGHAAVTITRLKGIACLLAHLGDDNFGTFIRSTLESYSVDCSLVSTLPGKQSAVSSICINPNGERQIVNYRNDGPDVVTHRLMSDAGFNAVLTDGRWHAGTLHALEFAKAHGIPGVLDAEAPVSIEAMQRASHIAFSMQGLNDFAPDRSVLDGLLEARDSTGAWVCVTDGEHGVHVLNGSRLHTISAPAVEAVDTLGAGDVWHAAFTLRLANGEVEEKAAHFANVTAAIKCTRAGGIKSVPSLDEVKHWLLEADS